MSSNEIKQDTGNEGVQSNMNSRELDPAAIDALLNRSTGTQGRLSQQEIMASDGTEGDSQGAQLASDSGTDEVTYNEGDTHKHHVETALLRQLTYTACIQLKPEFNI